MYSASVVEKVVLFCFFEHLLANLLPKNYALPELRRIADYIIQRMILYPFAEMFKGGLARCKFSVMTSLKDDSLELGSGLRIF
ncbi:hypothetical protein Tco_0457810 [Tanacetum coccineum]